MSGQGNEPKLEFSSTLIEFGPVLPHSAGDEKEVIVRNPSSFPVEIYSLEFDKQYLEEEKVLTLLQRFHSFLINVCMQQNFLKDFCMDFFILKGLCHGCSA